MLSEDSLQRAAEAAGIDAPMLWREQTGSTNSDAIALAERGAPEHTVVAAGYQVAGRGRLGRTWTSAPGSSLLLSVVLRPDIPAEHLPLVSLSAAVEMAEACRGVFGLPVGLKWPNDLMVRGRKLAGVLPEAKLDRGRAAYVVVGIGVNLRQRPEDFPAGVRDEATSVELEGAAADDEREAEVVSAFLGRLKGMRAGERGWDRDVVTAARAVCETLGRDVRATTVGGGVVEGRAADLDDRGGLVIVSGGRRETVAFGEVQHLR